MPIVNVMQEHELKNAYIGEYHEVICDFTQSDAGFSVTESRGTTYGRDSNWFYYKSESQWGGACRFLIPSSVTSKGTPKMIKLYWKNLNNWAWIGISEGMDTKVIRIFWNKIQCVPYSWLWAWWTPNETNVSALAEDVLVIDFENGICYLESAPSTTATVYPTPVLQLWTNGTLNLSLLSPNKNNYGYLQKAEFYF